jgi:hypothetical protein
LSIGEFDVLLNNLREAVRIKKGQKAEASVGIMDSQSVRWGNNRSLNGIIRSMPTHKKRYKISLSKRQ